MLISRDVSLDRSLISVLNVEKVRAERSDISEVVDEAKQKMEPVLGRLESALSEGPWLVGEEFTLADIAYAPFVNRLQRLMFHELWADKPKVSEWMAHLQQRPSFAPAVGPADQQMPCPADDA